MVYFWYQKTKFHIIDTVDRRIQDDDSDEIADDTGKHDVANMLIV